MALTRQEITQKVIEIVAEVLKIDPKTITVESSFEALGADSLDMMELIMKIEEAFDVTIPDEATVSITTVGQAVGALMDLEKAH